MALEKFTFGLIKIWEKFHLGMTGVGKLYHPRTWREKGMFWSVGLLLATAIIALLITGWLWNKEPASFNIRQAAITATGGDKNLVTGSYYTATLLKIGDVILNKRGGYLSNDVTPPGVLMDNIPNWEFGALVMERDALAALRNHFARSQSQSVEDPDLSRAEPQWNFNNNSWILPSTESEYRKGLKYLRNYINRMANPKQKNSQFFARADNLRQYLEIVSKRLGSLSQRLSASVGQLRVNTDLAGDSSATQSTATPARVQLKTSWWELDNVFYEARGSSWALLHILKAIGHDFDQVLKKKNAQISLQQIIQELEGTQGNMTSPFLLNGGGFGLFANYSLVLANYIARANTAIIDLRDLLQQG